MKRTLWAGIEGKSGGMGYIHLCKTRPRVYILDDPHYVCRVPRNEDKGLYPRRLALPWMPSGRKRRRVFILDGSIGNYICCLLQNEAKGAKLRLIDRVNTFVALCKMRPGLWRCDIMARAVRTAQQDLDRSQRAGRQCGNAATDVLQKRHF